MAITNTVSLPRDQQSSDVSISFAPGTPVENNTTKTVVIPVAAQNLTPTAVFSGTSTTSPKTITPAKPLSANIRAGSVISGGSFAGTEVVSSVTKNSDGKITSVTYTGTGSVNASAADFTVTDAEYDPVLYYLRITQTGTGAQLNVKVELLPLPGTSSSESSGAEGGSVSNAVESGKVIEHSFNLDQWRQDLGYSRPTS